jgi:opacity protein-like surface antigen
MRHPEKRSLSMLTLSFRTLLVTSILLSACLGLLLAPSTASAEGFQITPIVGHRGGGEFEDEGTGVTLSLSDENTVGFIIDKDVGPGKQAEFYYSHQPTSFSAKGTVTTGALFDLDIDYYHLGGRQLWDMGKATTFVVASVGATHFAPQPSSLESMTKFSIGLGGGVELDATERIGFRLEGRGFATFLKSDDAVFCNDSGGCVVLVDTDVLYQYEVSAGVILKF